MPHETFHYRSWTDIENTADALGISLPRSENTDVLKAPLKIGAFTAHNRIALQPMEGTDGTETGSPGELTVRRYLRFARGGAGLIWFEAVATAPEVRASAHHHFNVVNNGTITNLPDDCVVEVPGYVDGNGISIPKVGDLPLGCAACCNSNVSVQRLAVEAAVRGDIKLLRQAMLMDPLTGAACEPDAIYQMVDELLIEEAEWLPQYAEEIEKARQRIAESKAGGTFIPPIVTEGAARLHTKTVEEMLKDRECANVAQSVEQRFRKPQVRGSSPLVGSLSTRCSAVW